MLGSFQSGITYATIPVKEFVTVFGIYHYCSTRYITCKNTHVYAFTLRILYEIKSAENPVAHRGENVVDSIDFV